VRARKLVRHGVPAALCVGVVICFLIGCGESGESPKTKILLGSETARVTSPNGQLDAVIIREDGGGAAGGWEWYVYIVPKASGVDESKAHAIFNAGTLTGEKLVWNQEHLLEIQYDIAGINQFRNLWGSYEMNNRGSDSEGHYYVEIRLAPSSSDFSLLTRDGGFRRQK
jgi:hypothetical protein